MHHFFTPQRWALADLKPEPLIISCLTTFFKTMSLLQHCQVCRKVCRPLRCRQCRNAFYCSINCQKIDWKAGHRRTCSKRPEDKVVHALQELRSIAQTLPLDRAKEHFDKATDVVEKQMEQEKLEKNDSSKSKISKARDRKVDVKQDTKNATKAFTVDQGFLKPKVTATRQPMVPHFLFCAEEMKHISCFQITLRQSKKQSTIPIGDDLDLSSNRTDGSHTLILLREKKSKEIMFAAELPRHLIADQCSWRIEDEYTIQLRLQYEEDPCELYTGVSKCHPAEVINEVHCRYCEQALLPKKNIQRVCQLPEGHWDEIADYLICYNGVRLNVYIVLRGVEIHDKFTTMSISSLLIFFLTIATGC